jgi:hypothetical protein
MKTATEILYDCVKKHPKGKTEGLSTEDLMQVMFESGIQAMEEYASQYTPTNKVTDEQMVNKILHETYPNNNLDLFENQIDLIKQFIRKGLSLSTQEKQPDI